MAGSSPVAEVERFRSNALDQKHAPYKVSRNVLLQRLRACGRVKSTKMLVKSQRSKFRGATWMEATSVMQLVVQILRFDSQRMVAPDHRDRNCDQGGNC